MKVSMRLFKRKNNGVYYIEFDRNQIRSLKTKDEGEAKELYAATRSLSENSDRLLERNTWQAVLRG